jgi:diguanylate cyclase (GGDEF)-like protein/PAS domain S-box-containing protein
VEDGGAALVEDGGATTQEIGEDHDTGSVTVGRDAAGVIVFVGTEMPDILGWRPEELIGRPSTDFIHPEDQASAITAWFAMLDAAGDVGVWQGRYRTSDGSWKWIESTNTNRLTDESNPIVISVMKPVTVEKVSLTEALRAREQLLTRLSDVLPIGVFQIDAMRTVTFANDQLTRIVGHSPSATVEAQFSTIDVNDRQRFLEAVDAVLNDRSVDELELHIVRSNGDAEMDDRFCVVSMRPLTDATDRIAGAVGCVSDVTEQVRLRRQLERRANFDGLTSCLNRSAILDVLTAHLDRPRSTGQGVAAVFVDLCHFKAINDRFGHTTGDEILSLTANRLRSVVRDGDLVGRFGGDEFLVVCPQISGEEGTRDIAERIRRALAGCVEFGAGRVDLRASVGGAYTVRPLSVDALVAQADRAMYRSKRLGSSVASVVEANEEWESVDAI